jgi:hypothetical protein
MGILDKLKQAAAVVQTVASGSSNLIDGFQSRTDTKEKTSTSVTSSMYDTPLEKLIEMSILDGELTEKKRQFLLRKAEASGIDPAEFEIILDARLYEKQQNNNSVVEQSVLNPIVEENKTSIQTLFHLLNEAEEVSNKELETKIEQRRIEHNKLSAKDVAKLAKYVVEEAIPGVSLVKELFSDGDNDDDDDDNKFEREIDELKYSAKEKLISRAKNIITAFPVSMAKDEVIEFLSNATPKAKQENSFTNSTYHNEIAPTWKIKCEQIIKQARLSLKNDASAMDIINEYAKQFSPVNELSEKLDRIANECISKKKKLREQRKCIKLFPIPQTSADILDLLRYILPKTKTGFDADKNVMVWRNKFKKILSTAKVFGAKDLEMKSEIELFEEQFKTPIFPFFISLYMQLSLTKKIILWFILCIIVMSILE